MLRVCFGCGLMVLLTTGFSVGQEHRVEVIEGAPKAKELTDEVAATLADKGLKIVRGTSRTVCEIWPCKSWEVASDFKPTTERLYPFKPGHLLGVLHFRRRGKDFRDQTMKSGWYTLRYALQPIDGNHEGTSPTRDFVLMTRADEDKSSEPVGMKRLLETSAAAAGSSHPAMMCFQHSTAEPSKKPSIRHIEEKDWWIVRFPGVGVADGKEKELSVDLIVAGYAEE